MDAETIDRSKKVLKSLIAIFFISVTVVPLILKGQRDGYTAGLIILIVVFLAVPGMLYFITHLAQKISKDKEIDLESDHSGAFSLVSGGIGKAIIIGLGIITVFFIIAFFIPMPYKIIALLIVAYLMISVLKALF